MVPEIKIITMKTKYLFTLWCLSLLCAFWMYGFFCYVWNGTLKGLTSWADILDPIVQFGFIGPLLGLPAAIICVWYGKLWGKIISVPLLCFHLFWILNFTLLFISKISIGT